MIINTIIMAFALLLCVCSLSMWHTLRWRNTKLEPPKESGYYQVILFESKTKYVTCLEFIANVSEHGISGWVCEVDPIYWRPIGKLP